MRSPRLLLLLLFLLTGTEIQADGWRAVVPQQPNLPASFLGIDKSRQELFFYEHHSPLKLVHNFTCSTGQVEGDKFKEGDLRTPEGVYFLERRLDKGLDYSLYGDLAFTLNYPNPVDRIRGKSGYGIWIHGRGHSIVSRETKGCVALNTPDLHVLTPRVILGQTPVTIARELSIEDADETQIQTFIELQQAVEAWKQAWEQGSSDYFLFYYPERFALSSGKSFSEYTAYKERLFRQYPWIDVVLHDIRIIPGPGYWVTYFGQLFVTPSFQSEGIKRLYWQKDSAQEFRIVGSEWVDGNMGLQEQYFQELDGRVSAWLAEWQRSWLHADLKEYLSFYAEQAVQGGRRGRESIQAHKEELWSQSRPERLEFGEPTVVLESDGIAVTFRQTYRSMDGFQDEGIKTLVLKPSSDGFQILDEQWSAL
ncbi:MAG: L,D-transpeptidase family protein [Desulfovibrionales bacterium]